MSTRCKRKQKKIDFILLFNINFLNNFHINFHIKKKAMLSFVMSNDGVDLLIKNLIEEAFKLENEGFFF